MSFVLRQSTNWAPLPAAPSSLGLPGGSALTAGETNFCGDSWPGPKKTIHCLFRQHAKKMKTAMLLLLGPVLVQSSVGPASSAPSAPAATAQGDDPAIVTFDGVGVITDPGIDPTCSDIDFEDADVVVSNLGGTKHCCNLCSDDTDYLCCPTVASDETSMVRAPRCTKTSAHPH